MQTPDEIKAALGRCAEGTCEGGKYCSDQRSQDVTHCLDWLLADALAYIQRLEAELAVTRERLKNHGDLCDICSNTAKMPEMYDTCEQVGHKCANCQKKCFCKACDDSCGKEGFEWIGGQSHA